MLMMTVVVLHGRGVYWSLALSLASSVVAVWWRHGRVARRSMESASASGPALLEGGD
jgi:hypothetical protein